jgi:hypothetical protein
MVPRRMERCHLSLHRDSLRAPVLLLLLLAIGCASAPGPGGTTPDRNGDRFLCGPRNARSVCLPVVREGCAVRFVEGESIPPEAEERIVVRRPSGGEVRVGGPADLAGCVHIASAADALEYLRLFSSFATVHLFESQRLEVFQGPSGPACQFTCLPPRVWRKLRLVEPQVTPSSDGSFKVTRTVMKPEPQLWMPTLYRLTERVAQDGAVEILAEERISATPEDLAGLTFPMYL